MNKLILKPCERLDNLQYGGLCIIQNPSLYCFTSDAVLLANMVKANSRDTVVDFGTGSGIIATIIATKTKAKKVIGLELQEELLDMATRSVQLNNLVDKIEIISADIKQAENILGVGTMSVVVCNPPYESLSIGESNASDNIAICRHEVAITLEEIIQQAGRVLKFRGKLYIIHKARRLAESMSYMRTYGIEPKVITLITPKPNKRVDTVIIEAIRGGEIGVEIRNLTVYNENGTYTKEAEVLYKTDRI